MAKKGKKSQIDTVQEVAPKQTVENRTQPGRRGGTLKVGNPGGGGGGDNSSKARRIRLEAMSKRFLDTGVEVAGDPTHKDYAKVGTWATEMLEGRPKQSIEGGDKPLELIVRVVRE